VGFGGGESWGKKKASDTSCLPDVIQMAVRVSALKFGMWSGTPLVSKKKERIPRRIGRNYDNKHQGYLNQTLGEVYTGLIDMELFIIMGGESRDSLVMTGRKRRRRALPIFEKLLVGI